MSDMVNLKISDIENIEFWTSLNPDLSISDKPFRNKGQACQLDSKIQARLRQQMIEEGYFQAPPILKNQQVAVLRDTVIMLNNLNIMPLFAAVYDEFWILLSSLRNTFVSFLNEDYRLVPDFWIWHVDADDQSTGWKPHRDGNMWHDSIRNDGTPTLCTAWIGLSDIETSNSCIYVLPRKYDAIFQDFARRRVGQPGIDNAKEIPIPLNRIRALPIKAGAILGWDTNLLHWGSGSSKWASQPRISIGVYYVSADSKEMGMPYSSEERGFIGYDEPNCQLTFENRLVIIANIINNYINKFERDGEVEKGYSSEVNKFQKKWFWKNNE